MAEELPLQIQRLGGVQSQTLVLLKIATLQSSGEPVSPSRIAHIYDALRIPPSTNISRDLGRLADAQLATRSLQGGWAVTPEGSQEISNLMAGIGDEALAALGGAPDEPQFAELSHHLLHPVFAPAEFEAAIGRFLQGHPFERNVFCMTRFPPEDEAPLIEAIEACRGACAARGLELHLASDRTVADLLLGNVAAAMWASQYGIAILEDRADRGLNYNVVFEVGAMLVTGRRCLLLRDETSPDLPTDLVGRIYTPVNVDDRASVEAAVSAWITDTLGIR